MSTIRLQSSDGEIFAVDAKAAKISGTIRTLLDDCGIEEGSDTAIPLPNVSADILRKVLVYVNYHKDDPVPLNDDKCQRTDNISAWDAEYCKEDHETLFQLLLAANYLDINGLLNLVCKTLAKKLRNKTANQIREDFDLINDFTAAEEEQVRRENEWCGEY